MRLLLLLTTLLYCLPGHAQQLDSLKYPNGWLYYHTYGKGAPVIVLSGGPGNSCLQQEQVAIELGKHYRAILPEQRGTGLSIPVPFDSTTINLEEAVADIQRLLQKEGISRVVIYGHSWGAMLAMSFAAAHPEKVKALVLANPGYYKFSADFMTTHMNNLRARLGISDLETMETLNKKIEAGKADGKDSALFNRTVRLAYIYNKADIDSLMARIYIAKPNVRMQTLMVTDLQRVHFDLSKNLPQYKGPITVIGSRQDPLAFYTYELKIIRPDLQLHWIQAAGHFPMFEQPAAFNQVLEKVMTAAITNP